MISDEKKTTLFSLLANWELSIEEKIAKISNLLTYMRRLGEIANTGSATKPLWKLTDNQ